MKTFHNPIILVCLGFLPFLAIKQLNQSVHHSTAEKYEAITPTTPLPPALIMDCEALFFDPGGPDGDYQPGDTQVTTFCPDNPDDFVSIQITEWDLGSCCNSVLEVHLGNTLGLIVQDFTGSSQPLMITTFESGCITLNFVAGNNAEPAAGWAGIVSCSPCPPPFDHFIESIDQSGASIFAFVNPVTFGLQLWEAGPSGFEPGTGTATSSGETTDEFIQITGLESGTPYDVYVTRSCPGIDTSIWYGPIFIYTLPQCGDDFYDPGGPNGDIPLNTFFMGSICPNSPDELVSITFDSFDLGECCTTIDFYQDGVFYNWLGSYGGNFNPGTISTDFPGDCLVYVLNAFGTESPPGWSATTSCLSCPPPSNFSVNRTGSTFAEVTWPTLNAVDFYYFEAGLPGFTPGTNEVLASGNVGSGSAIIPGLTSNTAYEIYVRTHCSATDTSTFSQPFQFTTSPSCNESFYDPGGPDDNYPIVSFSSNTICPDQPGDFVFVNFDTFDISPNSFLEIYDGENNFIQFLGSWSGNNSPGSVSATNPSGCLTFILYSSGSSGFGWEASVECAACSPPNNLIMETSGFGLNFIWNSVNTGNTYNWEIGPPGFIPGSGTAVQSGSTFSTNVADVNGLDGGEPFEFYVQTDCGNDGLSSFAGPISFFAPPACGDLFYDPEGPDGGLVENTFSETIICPDQPLSFAQLTFTELDINPCCANLFIDAGQGTVFVNLNVGIPEPILSVASNGCILVLLEVFSNGANDLGEGWVAEVDCIACPPPRDFAVTRVSGQTVEFRWNASNVTQNTGWEIGLKGFTPGTGTAVTSGTSPNTIQQVLASGLTANTDYEIYLTNFCSTDTSTVEGPHYFRTAPFCDGTFFDPGGPDSNIVFNQSGFTGFPYITVLCPDQTNQYIEVSFQEFDIAQSFIDRLTVFNGINGFNQIGSFTGDEIPPMVTSTDVTGCLTFEFQSQSLLSAPEWEATTTCLSCPGTNGLTFSESSSNQLEVSWNENAIADMYYLEIGLKDFEPGTGMEIQNATVSGANNTHTFTGLESGTFYDVYIRSNCNSEESPFSQSILVSTEPTCGDFFYDPGGPNDPYPNNIFYTSTICPDNSSQKIIIDFTIFNTQSCCDFMNIFDGPDFSSPFIGSFSGSFSPGEIISTHSSGCLTIEFSSDGTGQGNGWEGIISCFPPNSTEDLEKEHALTVLPNPFEDELTLRFQYPVPDADLSIELHNIIGQRVLQQSYNVQTGLNEVTLPLKELPAGTYLISLNSEQGKLVKKVVKF